MSDEMSDDLMYKPTQIVRHLEEGELAPYYSPEEFWLGVCHVPRFPKEVGYDPRKMRGFGKSTVAATAAAKKCRTAASKKKFTDNRTEIYELLKKTRNARTVARQFKLCERKLREYVDEDRRDAKRGN